MHNSLLTPGRWLNNNEGGMWDSIGHQYKPQATSSTAIFIPVPYSDLTSSSATAAAVAAAAFAAAAATITTANPKAQAKVTTNKAHLL